MDEENKIILHAIIEVVGKPKEHVEKTLEAYLEKIAGTYTIKNKDVKEAIEVENSDLFSIFADITLEVKTEQEIFNFCLDYMPASIEIEDPTQLTLTNENFSNIVNDMLGNVHRIDMEFKKANQQNLVLAQSLGVVIQNAILILLSKGPTTIEQMEQFTGIKKEQLPKFLNKLKEDKKIKEEADKYLLV